MRLSRKPKIAAPSRDWLRFSHLRELSVIYEGSTEIHPVRTPDISPRGMFVNTPARFPEGTVLKVHFRLARSNHAVRVRCEVRYCLPGVGLGVEFIDIAPQDQKAIRDEIESSATTRSHTKRAK